MFITQQVTKRIRGQNGESRIVSQYQSMASSLSIDNGSYNPNLGLFESRTIGGGQVRWRPVPKRNPNTRVVVLGGQVGYGIWR